MHCLDDFSPCRRPACRSALARCDVRVKLIVAVAAILAVVVSTHLALPLVVLGACLVTLLAARMPLGEVAGRLAAPLAVAVLVCLLQGFMTGTTPAVAFDLGPWRLVATREGLANGALVGCRVMGSVSVILVLCLATPADRIFAALRWARVPRTWIEIGMLMYRYTFTLFEQGAAAVSAQKIRLGYAGVRRSLSSMGSLAGIVALRSIDQAERTHEAMVARGYQGSLPIPTLGALSRRDRWIIAATVTFIVSALLLAERCPL